MSELGQTAVLIIASLLPITALVAILIAYLADWWQG